MTTAPAPIAQVFAQEWPQLVATLRADLGDLDAAEDAAQHAFLRANEHWPRNGTPLRPGAWLLTTARRHVIDNARRAQRFERRVPELQRRHRQDRLDHDENDAATDPAGPELDDQLAMVLGCCHPSLADDLQVALTLRYVAGLSTEQIATAFLVPTATMAKRLTRAKAKVAAAAVPFRVPDDARSALAPVLRIIYLIFTEGHRASAGEQLLRGDLCDEAGWLAGHLVSLTPDEPEPLGLAALIAFTDARRAARCDDAGRLVLLEHQDRSRWDSDRIEEGHRLLRRALLVRRHGPYQIQAAIAGVHASAQTWEETDWQLLTRLYRRLHQIDPSPVVQLNHGIARSMLDGPQAGLDIVEPLRPALDGYQYFHATRARLLERIGRSSDAARAYERAIELCTNDAERQFLRTRQAHAVGAWAGADSDGRTAPTTPE